MEFSRFIASWAIALVGALSVAGILYQRSQSPGFIGRQVTITTAPVTVVVIPGFPVESILIGASIGLLLLVITRRRSRSLGT